MTSQSQYAADEITPVHCSSEIYLLRYGVNWREVHRPFLEENYLPTDEPPAFSIPGTRNLLSDVQQGTRRLDWCPPDVSLYHHLYPFFLSRGLSVYHKLPDTLFESLQTHRGVWIVSANRDVCIDAKEHDKLIKESGFFRRILRPNVVHLLYLIALAEYRGLRFVEKNVPYRSFDQKHLLFARTASRVELSNIEHTLVVAYVPRKAVCIWQYRNQEECGDLLTPDIVLLKPVVEQDAIGAG